MSDFHIEMGNSNDLVNSGYVRNATRLDMLRSGEPKDPITTVAQWVEEFRITPGEMKDVFRDKSGKNKPKLFDSKEINKNHPEANINFWIANGVGKRPDLKTKILDKDGITTYEVSVKKAEEYEKLENKQKATRSQAMSSAMVALAKIEAVKPMMLDVYPGLSGSVDLAEAGMETMIKKIMSGENPNFGEGEEIWVPRLNKKVVLTISSIILISSIWLSACGAPATVEAGNVVTNATPTQEIFIPDPFVKVDTIPTLVSMVQEFPVYPAGQTEEENLKFRNERIGLAKSNLEANPDLWNSVPESCRKSMTKFWVEDVDGNRTSMGSASIIREQKVENNDGGIGWVYVLITADHVMRGGSGEILEKPQVILFPGDTADQRYRYNSLGYRQFVDKDVMLDSGVVAIFAFGDDMRIDNPDFAPLGIENVRAMDPLVDMGNFTTFDYPSVTGTRQFTDSTLLGETLYPTGNYQYVLNPDNDSSTIATGSSGGAMCSLSGDHVGMVASYNKTQPYTFNAEGNPDDIREQIDKAFEKTSEWLKNNGFKLIE